VNLTQATLYKLYTINKVSGDEKERLQAIGMIQGEQLRLLSKAPFKGPFICQVNGMDLAIDYTLTKNIEITE